MFIIVNIPDLMSRLTDINLNVMPLAIFILPISVDIRHFMVSVIPLGIVAVVAVLTQRENPSVASHRNIRFAEVDADVMAECLILANDIADPALWRIAVVIPSKPSIFLLNLQDLVLVQITIL